MTKITPLKISQILFLVCLIYFTVRIIGGGQIMLIDNADLIFHEAGHTIFLFLGETAHFLGGTLGQLFFPCLFFFYFFYQRNIYSTLVMSWWAGENLTDIALYMKDARAQLLPLLGGDSSIHDWMFLFTKFDLLRYDTVIGTVFWYIGIFLMALSILVAGYFVLRPTSDEQPPDEANL